MTKRQLIGGLGFGTVAQTYDHIRPGYPQSAIDWVFVGLGDSLDVVDVGAGTGKLTAPEGLLDLVRSRSYVIALSTSRREAFLNEVRELLETHPQLAGRGSFPLPYITSAFRYTRV